MKLTPLKSYAWQVSQLHRLVKENSLFNCKLGKYMNDGCFWYVKPHKCWDNREETHMKNKEKLLNYIFKAAMRVCVCVCSKLHSPEKRNYGEQSSAAFMNCFPNISFDLARRINAKQIFPFIHQRPIVQ